MTTNLTALFYVLSMSGLAYLFLSKAIKPITNPKDFNIWVLAWALLTAVAFLATDLLQFFAASAVLIFYFYKRVENKFYLYIVLLFVVPGYIYKLPIITLNFQVLIGLMLLLPIFIGLTFRPNHSDHFKKSFADIFLIAYLSLVFFLDFRGVFVRPGEGIQLTYISCIKNGINIFLQFYLPYFVASRYLKSFEQIKHSTIAFVTICLIISPIAIAEVVQSDLFYLNLQNTLNVDWSLKEAVHRSNLVRATASVEHPLYLGTTMLIAIMLYFFVSRFIKNKLLALIGGLILIGGLLAPLSRGPWTGAALALICYMMMGNHKIRNLAWGLSIGIAAVLTISLTGHLDDLISFLPFVGNVDEGNIDYRAQLIDTSLILVEESPFFGTYNPEYHKAMQSLVQGEGIVDIVNLYLGVLLNYGFVGLFLYVGFFTTVTLSLFKSLFLIKDKSSPEFTLGKSLLAILIGLFIVMTVIANSSFFNTLLFILVGLSVSYVRVIKKRLIPEVVAYPTTKVRVA